MAKKHPRSGKPTPGGRVTPKGVRPDGTTTGQRHHAAPAAPLPQARREADHGRRFVAPAVPTRAGHQRGQR